MRQAVTPSHGRPAHSLPKDQRFLARRVILTGKLLPIRWLQRFFFWSVYCHFSSCRLFSSFPSLLHRCFPSSSSFREKSAAVFVSCESLSWRSHSFCRLFNRLLTASAEKEVHRDTQRRRRRLIPSPIVLLRDQRCLQREKQCCSCRLFSATATVSCGYLSCSRRNSL